MAVKVEICAAVASSAAGGVGGGVLCGRCNLCQFGGGVNLNNGTRKFARETMYAQVIRAHVGIDQNQ